jgi:signal peptide peptidase SppA
MKISRITSSLYNTPLLISQQGFSTLIDRVEQFNKKLDTFQGDEQAFFSFFLGSNNEDDQVENGAAIVEVSGVIQQKEDIFTRYFGDTSTEQIKRKIQSHLANDKVERIILKIDSPGGTVPGVMSLASFIFEARSQKEIIAFVNPLAASAAFWIASACSKIYHAEDTSSLGSIGVYITFFDQSKYMEDLGIKVNEFKSSEYKTMGSPFREPTEKEREQIQADVELLQDMFAGSVSKYRGIEKEKVLSFEARVYRGEQAIENGLSDGKKSLQEIIGMPNKDKVNKDKIKEEDENVKDEEIMDEEEEAMDEDNKEKATSYRPKNNREKKIAAAAAKRERTRISGIREITQPGLESFMEEQIESGVSVAEAALAQTKEIQGRGITMSGIKEDSPGVSVSTTTKADNNELDITAFVPEKYRK